MPLGKPAALAGIECRRPAELLALRRADLLRRVTNR
jgi:hypothetical protein